MVALPIARLWAAERGLATVAPHDECDITQKGGQFPTAGGTVIMAKAAGAFSVLGVVVMGASEALMPRHLGEGRKKLPSPLDAVRNSSTPRRSPLSSPVAG
jgi:hypothetical protein